MSRSEYLKEWRRKNPDKVKRQKRNYALRHRRLVNAWQRVRYARQKPLQITPDAPGKFIDVVTGVMREKGLVWGLDRQSGSSIRYFKKLDEMEEDLKWFRSLKEKPEDFTKEEWDEMRLLVALVDSDPEYKAWQAAKLSVLNARR